MIGNAGQISCETTTIFPQEKINHGTVHLQSRFRKFQLLANQFDSVDGTATNFYFLAVAILEHVVFVEQLVELVRVLQRSEVN